MLCCCTEDSDKDSTGRAATVHGISPELPKSASTLYMPEIKQSPIQQPSPFKGVVTLDPEVAGALPPLPMGSHSQSTGNEADTPMTSNSSRPLSGPNLPLHHSSSGTTIMRSRKNGKATPHHHRRGRRKRPRRNSKDMDKTVEPEEAARKCCRRYSLYSCMNVVAKMVFWVSTIFSVAAVIWYSYELKNNGYVQSVVLS